MLTTSPRSPPGVLWVLSALFVSVCGDKMSESRSGMIQDLRAAVAELAGEGKSYLGTVIGEQTVLTVQKSFAQVLGSVAGSAAAALNVLLHYVSQLLQAAGLQVGVPRNKVTAEGLIFVTQWVLITLIGYWLLSLVFRLLASALRQVLWFVKITAALVCFGVILSDRSVDSETTAIRIAVLLCVCILLGIRPHGGSSKVADKTSRLEEQVKILERRLRQVERLKNTEE